MYTIYIPKYEKSRAKPLITEIIRGYMRYHRHECGIISAPGYMPTAVWRIDNFIENLCEDIQDCSKCTKPCKSPCDKVKISYANGMNGSNTIATTGKTITEKMEEAIAKTGGLDNLELNWAVKKDHRKMLFFFRKLREYPSSTPISLENYEQFLKTIEVTAVMIGSSNQSFHTYYQTPAPKGEADIFMFSVDDPFGECVSENGLLMKKPKDLVNDHDTLSPRIIDEVVISKSIYTPYGNCNDFLRKILEDFLKNSLE